MGFLDRLAQRRPDALAPQLSAATPAGDPVCATKALRKFLRALAAHERPVLLDLGPVVGSNVTFFGEQLGCKILVENIYADRERHAREDALDKLPAFIKGRFAHQTGSVVGILCWDLLDYLDKKAAQALAAELVRVLAPDGALLAFFTASAMAQTSEEMRYTKYVIVDETSLRHRPYPATRGKQPLLPNRDIIRLFSGLRVSDSFLLQNSLREILFRKPS